MAIYTLKQLAACRGVTTKTMKCHISILMDSNKFIKTSPGKSYSESEVETLCKIMGFKVMNGKAE